LVTKQNWKALLIEGDPTAFAVMKDNYSANSDVVCLNSFVSFEGENTFDILLAKNNVPKEFDLFILDIDGNEYHVWESIKMFKPRVIVVEFNPTIPNEINFVQPRDMSVQQGSSLRAIVRIGEQLGYRVVAVTNVNAFFVREDIAQAFRHLDNSLNIIRADNPFETKLFQLYDGTLKISGNQKLVWHKLQIDEEKLQVLPKSRRVYLNGINSNDSIRKLKYVVRKIPIVYPFILLLRKIPFFRNLMH